MKYDETSKFPKFVGTAGFYTVIVCCLLALGAASWFAVARYHAAAEKGESSAESSLPEDDAYNNDSGAYSDNSSSVSDSAKTANSVSGVPYASASSATAPAGVRSFSAPVEGNVIKGYNDSALQYSATYGDMRLHTGVDIACENGAPVRAAGSGTVTAVEESASLGRTVTIDHGDGLVLRYCGLTDVSVKNGQKVAAQDVIGTAGTIPSECSDQSHLHLEATENGKAVSPLAALGLE